MSNFLIIKGRGKKTFPTKSGNKNEHHEKPRRRGRYKPEEQLPLVLVHRPPTFDFPFRHRLQAHFRLLDHFDSPEALSRHAQQVRVLLCVDPTPISADLLRRLPSLQLIVGSSAGVDYIDLSECRRSRIAITNAGAAFSDDVADYAVGLLIDVLRRVSTGDRFVRSGLWPLKGDYLLGFKVQFLFDFLFFWFILF